jgi:hypothetical protein
MARVKFDVDTHGLEGLQVIKNLMRLFPKMRGDLLGHIGAEGRQELKRSHLSGQDLNLRGDTDKRGRRTINFSVDRRTSRTTITSYPVNLFEKGYTLHGRKMPARNIITGKFKTTMATKLQSYINNWQNTKLDSILKQAE